MKHMLLNLLHLYILSKIIDNFPISFSALYIAEIIRNEIKHMP